MGAPTIFTDDLALAEIYELIDPRDGAVRYIGKANSAKARLKSHLRETRRNTPVYRWISKLRKSGVIPSMRVLRICPIGQWQEVERHEIKSARDKGVRLLNVADGGDEPFCPKDVRAANGRANTVKRTNTPFKATVYRLKRDMGQLLKAGYVGEETKKKLRQAASKRPDLFGQWAML